MMRRWTPLVLILTSVVTAPASAGIPVPGGPAPIVPDAMSHVESLAGEIGPRPAGSKADRRASRYVKTWFEEFGYDVTRMPFSLPQGGRSWNVVARVPGGSKATPLLVGAHYDTVAGSPGANDNASGVGVLLELARRLEGSPEAASVTFVAFGAEEFQPGTGRHHIGSEAYARTMRAPQRNALDAMVSVDMIGKVRRFIVARLAGSKRGASRLLARAIRDAGMRPRVRVLGDISDHGPFAHARMPAAFLWTGSEPNHHEPTDRVRNVSPKALRRAGRVLLALVELVA